MKANKELEDLVQKIADGAASEEEKDLFSRWMLSLDLSPIIMEQANLADIQAAMLGRILSAENEKPKEEEQRVVSISRKRRLFRLVASVAAVFLLVAGVLWVRRVVRSSSSSGDMIVIANSGQQIKRVQLPDSSRVWLNSGASLTFSQESYTSSQRRVSLQGEGYFEVVKDTKPFIVAAGGIDTRVLGTSFNVESYSNESEVRVTLVQGKVMVQDERHPDKTLILSPNQMMHYSRKKADWMVESADAVQVIQWIEGRLVFHELPLNEALARMEKKYGIVFQYDPALLEGKSVTANIPMRPWPSVLDHLLYIHQLSYHQKNGVIYITKQ